MDDDIPIKNWIVLVVMAFCGVLAFVFLRENSRKPLLHPTLATIEKPSFVIAKAILDQEERNILDPVSQRQAFFLKKTIIICSINRLSFQKDQRPVNYINSVNWDQPSSENVKKVLLFLKKNNLVCSHQLLDRVSSNAPFAGQLAQAIKSSGFELGAEYESIPQTWPPSMSKEGYSLLLAKMTDSH